jgi:redox-sensitive bicupin YhaK (pirin superfamily)
VHAQHHDARFSRLLLTTHVFLSAQMWVNLPAKHKMDPPAYQDVPSRSIPDFDAAPGVRAKVIAGCVPLALIQRIACFGC